MGPGPPGWRLGVGFTTPPRKNPSVRKPEMWPQKGLVEEVHYGGEGPHWAALPMKKKKNHFLMCFPIYFIFLCPWSIMVLFIGKTNPSSKIE